MSGQKKGFNHLAIFDSDCPFCCKNVQLLFRCDRRGIFGYAPLRGSTAARELADEPQWLSDPHTMVLIENFDGVNTRRYTQASAVLRILWLLGGPWKLLGWLYFLPAAPFNWIYRWVSRNRYRLISDDVCDIKILEENERLLP